MKEADQSEKNINGFATTEANSDDRIVQTDEFKQGNENYESG